MYNIALDECLDLVHGEGGWWCGARGELHDARVLWTALAVLFGGSTDSLGTLTSSGTATGAST
jgi:hypothetical protein